MAKKKKIKPTHEPAYHINKAIGTVDSVQRKVSNMRHPKDASRNKVTQDDLNRIHRENEEKRNRSTVQMRTEEVKHQEVAERIQKDPPKTIEVKQQSLSTSSNATPKRDEYTSNSNRPSEPLHHQTPRQELSRQESPRQSALKTSSPNGHTPRTSGLKTSTEQKGLSSSIQQRAMSQPAPSFSKNKNDTVKIHTTEAKHQEVASRIQKPASQSIQTNKGLQTGIKAGVTVGGAKTLDSMARQNQAGSSTGVKGNVKGNAGFPNGGGQPSDLDKLSMSMQNGTFQDKEDPSKILQTSVKNMSDRKLDKMETLFLKQGTYGMKQGEEFNNIATLLNREKYNGFLDEETKVQILNQLKSGELSVQDVRTLLISLHSAHNGGVYLKGKDGQMRSNLKIKGLSQLQKTVGGRYAGATKFSKATTLGLKGTQKFMKAANLGVRATAGYANAAINAAEGDITNNVDAAVDKIKTKVQHKTKQKVKSKAKSMAWKGTKKIATSRHVRSMVKKTSMTLVRAFKATIALAKGILMKVAMVVGGSFAVLFVPLIICFAMIVCMLSVFTGSDESEAAYNTLYASETSEYQSRVDDHLKELEAKKHPQPGKGEFENITDEEYESLLATQYIPDTVTTEGSSNIDYKAQMALFQVVSGMSELNNETVESDFLTLVKYWDEKGIIESYNTRTDTYNYDVVWTAKKDIHVNESATANTKSEALAACKDKIKGNATNGYQIISEDVSYTTKTNYELVEDKDEDGKVIGHHREIKDYTVTGNGSLHLEKSMSKTLTQYIYTLEIENGVLDDYINVSQDAYKNNTELTIMPFTLGTERSFTHVVTDGTTKKNMEAIWGFLRNQGFSEQAAAGIMGNIKSESNFNPAAIEASNGEGHGIVQWSFSRKEKLFARAAARGVEWSDMGVQLDMLLEELNQYNFIPYFSSLDEFKKCTDIRKATEAFMICFERPANQSASAINGRCQNSEGVYREMKGSTGTSSTKQDFGTVMSIKTSSKHYGQTFYYEELLNQQFLVHKAKEDETTEDTSNQTTIDRKELDEETINQVKELYSSDALMEGFEFLDLSYSGSSFGSFGFNGNIKDPIKEENATSTDYSRMAVPGNPFAIPQCTWFAWARFYQVYGYDSGARGNGNSNARQIVAAHPDKFQMSSSPAPGAVFSIYSGPYILPQYGHVGFVEAVEGDTMWVSEGNVTLNGKTGVMWFHKVSVSQWASQYQIEYAVPIQNNN